MTEDVPEKADPDPGEADDSDVQEEIDDVEAEDVGGDPDDVDEAVAEIGEDELGGGLFDGVEEADMDSSDEEGESGDESGGSDSEGDESDAPAPGELAPTSEALEDSINEGMAKLGTVGLTDEDLEEKDLTKKGLEGEFQDVFETFRLGYFGARFVEEYVLDPADDDVSPAWGLLGAGLMATAMIVWMRPDGTEAVRSLRDQVGDIAGGIA